MDKYAERIKEINNAIEKLEEEKAELRSQNTGYFIGVRYVGDGGYWDEYLVPLGKITEAEAYKWVEDNNNYCGPDYWMGSTEPYFKVSYENYIKYQFLAGLITMGCAIDDYRTDVKFINEHIMELKEKVWNDLGIRYPSYVHVVRE